MSFFDFFGGIPHGHSHPGMGGHEESDEETEEKDRFYKLLEIEKNASQSEIKKAYLKKARKWHPDRHPEEHEKYHDLFQELQQAYDVLGDEQKRQIYDRYGEKAALRGGPGGRSGGGGGGMDDLLSQMFGGGRRGGPQQSGPKKSPPIKKVLEVTLEDLYKGTLKKIDIVRHIAKKGAKACAKCDGQGTVTVTQMMGPVMFQRRAECPQCEGQGYKLRQERSTVDVHIPIGGRNGETVTVNGEGHRLPNHAPGDVILQLRQAKHETFTRQGADLGMNYKLSLREALCGFSIRVPHVSGSILVISNEEHPDTVQPGSLRRVYSQGMPQRFMAHVKGHLYIVMEVELPMSRVLSPNAVQELKAILPEQKLNDEGDEKNGETGGSSQGGGKKKGKKKRKKKRKQHQEEEEEDLIEEVECHEVEMEGGQLKATPYAAKGAAYDEDEDERDGVPCQQM